MIQIGTLSRNAMLDAMETAAGTGAVMRFYSGAMPANPAAAATGTLLAELTLPSDWMAAASSGTKAKSGTWQDTSADNSGIAGYWRLWDSAVSVCHQQGLCGQNWAASTAVALNLQAINGGNVYKVTTAGTTNSSGGPTGTGTGITDGTAVWAYVGTADMTLDSDTINAGQALTVSTFTWTAPNP